MNALRLALTKGRLERSCRELLKSIGYDCSPLDDPGRRLIHELTPPAGSSLPRLEAVLAKAPDVITYVAHGVCGLGITGKDTIMEQGGSFYEMLDLGLGRCRFALATLGGEDFYAGHKRRRVATKYPAVARQHLAKRGVDAEIIRIEGSVELAPLLGLADAIVDIVETGDTLKANGLVPTEDIHRISARLIVNVAAMKLRRAEVLAFCRAMEGAVSDAGNSQG